VLPDTPTPTRPLSIAYVGNYRAPWCTEVHVAATLEALGHTVHRVQEDDLHAGKAGPDGLGWLELPNHVAALGADLLLWTRTWACQQPDDQRTALAVLAERGVPTVAYHLDLYLGTVREHQIEDEPWWGSAHLFTPDQRLDYDVRTEGRHHWLPPAVYGPEARLLPAQLAYRADVAFVGSVQTYHPEWAHRRELVANLQRKYGNGFRRYPRAQRPVRGDQLNTVYSSSKVAVGDSYGAGTIPGYWSDRIPETIGRGGVLVHPNVPGLTECFTPGEHLSTWDVGDWGGMHAAIERLLADPQAREAQRAQGMLHVQRHHTYDVRLQQLLGYLADACPQLTVDGEGRPPVPMPPRDTSRVLPTGQRVRLRAGTTDEVTFREVWDQAEYHGAEPYVQGHLVLDVGANVGAFSLWALHHGAAKVLAYEPEPGNYAMLAAHTAGLNVDARQLAVMDDPGHIYLDAGPDDRHGGGTHCAYGQPLPADWEDQGMVRVEAAGINDVLREAIELGGGLVGVVKIDCEGGEYPIIDGVHGDLLAQVRCIVMEFHGPGMPHLPHLQGAAQVGPLLAKLAEYGRLDVLGRPSMGGTLTWRRY
jgi:FkbM family methyltransferase